MAGSPAIFNYYGPEGLLVITITYECDSYPREAIRSGQLQPESHRNLALESFHIESPGDQELENDIQVELSPV
jgi:hypothetical protein